MRMAAPGPIAASEVPPMIASSESRDVPAPRAAPDHPTSVATDFELGTETTSRSGKIRRGSPVSAPPSPPSSARDAGSKRRAAGTAPGSASRPFMPDDL